MKKYFVVVVCMLCCVSSILAQTERINFTAPWQYPEGVVYHKSANAFYVSGTKTGTIGKVGMDGKFDSIYIDKTFKSTYGLKVDEKKNLLWACVADPAFSNYSDSTTYRKMIRLVAIDLKTNQKVKDINLGDLYSGKHFANDLVLDEKGNLYITDSYSPVIYKVDASDKASLLVEHPLFRGGDVGLNGIAYKPGFLIVVNNSNGAILKVSLADPKNVTVVKVDQFFPGADGLLWDDKGNLLLIQNKGVNMVYQLNSTDDWKTAKIIATTKGTDRFAQPSTGTIGNGKIYVLNSKLNELKDPTVLPSKEFSIQVARLVPVE